MEIEKLTKFKLQLQTLSSQIRHLRERENSTQQQLNFSLQKQKEGVEEYVGRIKELQTELADSNENRRILERKVSSLESDNALLENKQKELKESINNLLQSRENFVNAYEESTCELKQAVLSREKKCRVLAEILNSHLSLFDSISKESSSIKQVLDRVQSLVTEKEGIVAGLRCKMDKLSSFEKAFVEKISDLENKLRDDKDVLRKKDKKISELEAQLETAILTSKCQPQIEELQTMLSMKDVVIEDLQLEKKVLQSELWSLGIIFQKVQLAVSNMNENDRTAFTSVVEGQKEHIEKEKEAKCSENCVLSTEEHSEAKRNEDDRTEDVNESIKERSTGTVCVTNTEGKTDSILLKHDSVDMPLQGNNSSDSSIPVDKGPTLAYHQDAESSTAQETAVEPTYEHSDYKRGVCEF